MATYLVTGVAGFIAARVAAQFLEAGHTVVGVDNLNDYYDIRLKYHRLAELARQADCADQFAAAVSTDYLPLAGADSSSELRLESSRFQFYPIDIENRAAVERLFTEYRFDAVVNLAARAGVRYSLENPFVYMTTNALGSLNLLECMRAHGVKRFVLASTSSLYAGEKMPFTEDLPVNAPLSPYAASKKAAETMAYAYHKQYGLEIAVVRYFTVFGPAGRPDMSIFRFIQWIDEAVPLEIFGDGTQTRDFTYVDDIARGTVAAATAPLGYEIINLGGGNAPVSLNGVIALIEGELGKKSRRVFKPFHAADMDATAANISKARRLLSWEPQVSFAEGLRKTVIWHKTNHAWLESVKI